MKDRKMVILGGGLAGLSAGCVLSREGKGPTIIEAGPEVGGLARTEELQGCRFDLGGHRFHTADAELMRFVKDLMGTELIHVPRSSKICLRGEYFDYPLRPLNALAGLSPKESVGILFDYARQKLRRPWRGQPARSLREKVIEDFGEKLFEIFFRDYSEKVWGLSCESISADWISKRIKGLSLGGALRDALIGKARNAPATLADSFSYPARGIGRISDRLREEVEKCGTVLTDTSVTAIHHSDSAVDGLTIRNGAGDCFMPADAVLSTIPLPGVIRMLRPQPPPEILSAASGLRYRDLLLAALVIDRPLVTDQTWIYFPDRSVPFGRLHEPKNWSAAMAPPDKTVLVVEYFCFAGDRTWATADGQIAAQTAAFLEKLGYIRQSELHAAKILRIPKAYPLFDVEYRERLAEAASYLQRFRNFFTAGRTGTFGYLNMDEALASGIDAAGALLSDGMGIGGAGVSPTAGALAASQP